MYPSALPDCPGLELIQARSLCCPNWSTTLWSMTLSLFLSSTLFLALTDFFSAALTASSLIFLPDIKKGITHEVDSVLLEIPFGEGSGIDGDDAVLDEGIGTDQLVVGCVIDDVDDSSFVSHGFRGPVEVSFLHSQSSEFVVASSHSDSSDSRLAVEELGVGYGSCFFVGSLLLVDGHSATGESSLVS